MATVTGKAMFPCPVCMQAREVRMTKKDKPYLVCDPCEVPKSSCAGLRESKSFVVCFSRPATKAC